MDLLHSIFPSFRMVFLIAFNFLLVQGHHAIAQNKAIYYGDLEPKEGGIINDVINTGSHMIIAGKAFDSIKYAPSIQKIDTLGNVVWSTVPVDTSKYLKSYGAQVLTMFQSDSFLYAVARLEDSGSWPKERWKVNSNTGKIVWKKAFVGNGAGSKLRMANIDSNRYCIIYQKSRPMSTTYVQLDVISKKTGDTLSSTGVGGFYGYHEMFPINVDSKQNIYFSINDTVFKVHASNPGNVIWKKRYASVKARYYSQIQIDNRDSIYLMGTEVFYDNGLVISIGTAGNLNWNKRIIGGDVTCQEYKDIGGSLYILWRHFYVGGIMEHHVTKVNKTNGQILWNSRKNIVGFGAYQSHSGSSEAGMSLDVNNSGDVFITGYYDDSNYGPESWSILKLRGSNGAKLFEQTITEFPSVRDDASSGKGACIINNQAYFVGELQVTNKKYYKRGSPAMVKINSSNGAILRKKILYGSFQFESNTLQIQRYGKDKTLVLKQLGRSTTLEMYDFNFNRIWSYNMFIKHTFLGHSFNVQKDGSIGVIGSSFYESSGRPTYINSVPDSTYFISIDSNGKWVDQVSFRNSYPDKGSVELLQGSDTNILAYHRTGLYLLRKIGKTGFSSEKFTKMLHYPKSTRTKYLVDKDSSTFLMCGTRGLKTRLYEIKKSNLQIKEIAILPVIERVNYVEYIDTNQLIMCGVTNRGEECLIRYNVTTKDTIWTKVYYPNGELLKFVIDYNRDLVLTAGARGDSISIKKIDAITGNELWEYAYQGTNQLKCEPTDIAFSKSSGAITVAGYQLDSLNNVQLKSVLIKTVDSNGAATNTIVKKSWFLGNSSAYSCCAISNGSIAVGGNLNDSLHGKAGFIYFPGQSKWVKKSVYIHHCGNYISKSGNQLWNKSGVYTDTMTVANNPDTIITVQFNSIPILHTYDTTSTCEKYISSKGQVWTSSGNYIDTIVTNGCDSILFLNLSVFYNGYDSVKTRSCNSYASPSGKYTWVTSGVHYDTLQTTNSCDSIIKFNVVIDTINTLVNSKNDTLIAKELNANYQWLNCNTGNTPIPGDTHRVFIPKTNGLYSVQVQKETCLDTSKCLVVIISSQQEFGEDFQMNVFPNPSNGRLTIRLEGSNRGKIELTIRDYSGKEVHKYRWRNLPENFEKEINLEVLKAGIYFLDLVTPKHRALRQITINK